MPPPLRTSSISSDNISKPKSKSKFHPSYEFIPSFFKAPPPPQVLSQVINNENRNNNSSDPQQQQQQTSQIQTKPLLITSTSVSSTSTSTSTSSNSVDKNSNNPSPSPTDTDQTHPQPPPPPPPPPPLSLKQQVKNVAKARFLARKERELLSFEELAKVEEQLNTAHSPPQPASHETTVRALINYETFCSLRKNIPKKALKYFTASFFLTEPRDKYGRISTQSLFTKICSAICIDKTRITLQFYDIIGQGYLREQDLENYIWNLIPDLPPLRMLNKNFFPFYVFTAVRRFMFFLDPRKTGRISILKLVSSPIMEQLLELGMAENEFGNGFNRNWFSADCALRVYSQYLELDKDENGMLNKNELRNFVGGVSARPMRLTQTFVDRIFEEIVTYKIAPRSPVKARTSTNTNTGANTGANTGTSTSTSKGGEMDYKTFLDFVLAMENKSSTQSIRYIWKLLDIDKNNYLDSFTINYFFRDIKETLQDEAATMADVKDEIFDMVRPRDGGRITFEDLVNCGCAETIIDILIDINGFWAYDNRESTAEETEDTGE